MPTTQQVQEFVGLQNQIGSLSRQYLSQLPEIFNDLNLLERYNDLIEKKNSATASMHDQAKAKYELIDMSTHLDRRGKVLRVGCVPMKDTQRYVPSFTKKEHRLLQQIIATEKRVQALSNHAYDDMLGALESTFLLHDGVHQHGELGTLFKNKGKKSRDDEAITNKINRFTLANPDIAMQGIAYARDQIGFLAAQSHNISPHMTTVDFRGMVKTITHLLSARSCVQKHPFDVNEHNQTLLTKNKISYHIDDIKAVANPGALYSIFYNYTKNSLKKLVEEIKHGKHENGASINLSIEDISPNYYAIFESDNGAPVCLDGFINQIKKMLHQEESDDILTYLSKASPKTVETIRRWQHQPFALHDLSIGDAAEIIHTGGITGIGQHYKTGSGIGLSSIRYLTEAHGGKVLYTQSYQTGGPIFAIVLPKDPIATNPETLEHAIKETKKLSKPRIEQLAA